MEHLDVQLAHQLLRGRLDAEAQAYWQRHVQGCPRCREVLTAERALMAVLNLGQAAPSTQSPDLGRLLDRVAALTPHASVRRWRILLNVGGLLAAAALALLFGWQLANEATNAEALARELRISAELQDKVVANFSALATLEHDPWLADQYEAVRTLEELIADAE